MFIIPPGPKQNGGSARHAKPYCECWSKRGPMTWKHLNVCSCGEDNDESQWKWQQPDERSPSRVVVSDDQKQVTFHPFYSSGTAAVKGDTPLLHNHHYYWEVKMLTETYGTDIMVGLGTNKVSVSDSQFEFTSLLGQDGESYGLSYTGAVRHNATTALDSAGFCRGTIIGVMVDMWRGTLEFYLNRKPQGISFYNLRRHQCLFPMVCSTAAQSSLRLIYASSWRASLLVDAAKILAASVSADARLRVPPGIWYTLRSNFWLTFPNQGCVLDEDEDAPMEIEPVKSSTSVLSDVLPSPYMNGFYVDSVEINYRVVVYE
ncbi:SPRY domain-containing SOCS box protein 3-like isoform X1 [Galleria mellonella]|uniref:SPRY domain-containing SOCS box protein 3-like isoform X1 n=1 Tax=Galleria mellonella TaxID=7137 RepID=A0ABM3MQP3_GALME|nr:SPRY domain-containing SOCS box protein 3-like isoform X1 [Galleria mellonella]